MVVFELTRCGVLFIQLEMPKYEHEIYQRYKSV